METALHPPGFQLHMSRQKCVKSRGGGICFYINERWCKDITVLLKSCTPQLVIFFQPLSASPLTSSPTLALSPPAPAHLTISNPEVSSLFNSKTVEKAHIKGQT